MSIFKQTMRLSSTHFLRLFPVLFILNLLPLAFAYLQRFMYHRHFSFGSSLNILSIYEQSLLSLTFFNIMSVIGICFLTQSFSNITDKKRNNFAEIKRVFFSQFTLVFTTIAIISMYFLLYFCATTIIINLIAKVITLKWLAILKYLIPLALTAKYLYTPFLVTQKNMPLIEAVKESARIAQHPQTHNIVIALIILYLPFFIIDIGTSFITDPRLGGKNYATLKQVVSYLTYIITPLKIMVMSIGLWQLYEKNSALAQETKEDEATALTKSEEEQ